MSDNSLEQSIDLILASGFAGIVDIYTAINLAAYILQLGYTAQILSEVIDTSYDR